MLELHRHGSSIGALSAYHLPMAEIGDTDSLLRMRTVSTGRKRRISNIHLFSQRSDISLFILSTLRIKNYILKEMIPVRISELSANEYLASFEEAGIAITGETPREAIRLFKHELIETYEIYKRESLGSGPKRQLAVLEKYIGKKGRE